MLLPRLALALALLPACATTRAAAPAPAPVAAAEPAPPAARELPADLVATPIVVDYRDVGDLARVLRSILDVRSDRGDVREILHDHRTSTLVVFATPAGLEAVRRVLAPVLQARTAAL